MQLIVFKQHTIYKKVRLAAIVASLFISNTGLTSTSYFKNRINGVKYSVSENNGKSFLIESESASIITGTQIMFDHDVRISGLNKISPEDSYSSASLNTKENYITLYGTNELSNLVYFYKTGEIFKP